MSCQQFGGFFMIQVALAVSVSHSLISSAGHCSVVPLILFVGTRSWSSTGVDSLLYFPVPGWFCSLEGKFSQPEQFCCQYLGCLSSPWFSSDGCRAVMKFGSM